MTNAGKVTDSNRISFLLIRIINLPLLLKMYSFLRGEKIKELKLPLLKMCSFLEKQRNQGIKIHFYQRNSLGKISHQFSTVALYPLAAGRTELQITSAIANGALHSHCDMMVPSVLTRTQVP